MDNVYAARFKKSARICNYVKETTCDVVLS